jgi:plastocyanin
MKRDSVVHYRPVSMVAGLLRATVGLLAALLLLVLPSGAVTHLVNVQNFTFAPNDLTVAQGDSVRWVWVNGSHTATSGAPCTPDGLFDAPLNSTHTSFTFVFNGPVGDYPYFCTFHCAMGMTGVIHVQAVIGAVPEGGPGSTTGLVQMQAPSPNPFDPRTSVRFALAQPAQVDVRVFDAQGRPIATLERGFLDAGEHAVVWDGRDDAGAQEPSGIYYVRASAGGASDSAMLIRVR